MKWINVKDRLPRDLIPVLVLSDGTVRRIMAYISNPGEEKWYNEYGEFIYKKYHTEFDLITHWMPLPLPPEESDD